ncbi:MULTISPECIES: DUF1654 domain-containing protein [unclassified Pseudomonas]|uniref:DUF1654 domain-containing protein n=1 Tax=unclassified Pseudomonas TaxID=196821 RepID=UPI0025CBCBE5|nr:MULTISPECIES: DUF1654 domain-containing protein [unclassified Pseudomonas]
MARAKKQTKPVVRQEMTGVERLGLRVSGMINSPRAQERCSALIHRLDTDKDDAWDEVMGLLSETDGVEVTFQDDGEVLIEWEKPTDEDRALEVGEVDAMEEEPAPF